MKMNVSNSLRRRLKRVAERQVNPGLSISRQVAKRLFILYSYGRSRWASKGYLGSALSSIREVDRSRTDREAIVIANGHSTNKLDVDRVTEAMKAGLDVFAINAFLLSDLSSRLTPSHYVLSDPAHRPGNGGDLSRRLWEVLDDNLQIQLFAPHTWYPILKDRRPSTKYFNDCGLEGWTKNILPTKARGYLSLTAYKALSIAMYFHYERIHIIGFDNSNYLNYHVDVSGVVYYGGDTHFYTSDSPAIDASDWYPQGMADCLFDYSLALLDLERCFGGAQIFNLDVNSSTRIFAKVADSRFISQMRK